MDSLTILPGTLWITLNYELCASVVESLYLD